jgi:hypothetical protein
VGAVTLIVVAVLTEPVPNATALGGSRDPVRLADVEELAAAVPVIWYGPVRTPAATDVETADATTGIGPPVGGTRYDRYVPRPGPRMAMG